MRHQFSLLKDRVGCSTEHRSHREQEDITTKLFRQVMRMLGEAVLVVVESGWV